MIIGNELGKITYRNKIDYGIREFDEFMLQKSIINH